MSIRNHFLLLFCPLMLLIPNSTVLAAVSSCKTSQTKTICSISCPVGTTTSLVCGKDTCTGGCRDPNKMFRLSGLVADIYVNSNGNIPVAKIINFLKENKGSISEEDKKYYGDIIFPDLKKEVSTISDDEWKAIEKSFSGLTKEEIMNRKYEDLLRREQIKPFHRSQIHPKNNQ